MSRITVKMRHTGRIYIGLDSEHYVALWGSVCRDPFISAYPKRLAVKRALERFNAELKALAGSEDGREQMADGK
jgi:hypothetical protein